ncbi:MAG TPA: flavin reductase family protein [Bacillota bacterium]|nr:flavin reductase family protein [Bacillota bacterium]
MAIVKEKTDEFREVMGQYPTGVSVVTTTNQQGRPVGMTINSFASVSLYPLLVLWSIDHHSSSYEAFKQTDQFAINILADDQADLCYRFSQQGERFHTNDWTFSVEKLPVISKASATLTCTVHERVEAGDHTILIGRVTRISNNKKEPLLYYRGNVGPITQ